MDSAINNTTKKVVNAFQVYKNGSYQNLNKKGEWSAPKDSVSNWEDISNENKYVHYVKTKNYNGTLVWCSPYFSKYPGSNANTVPESKMHKMLKMWLFNRLKKYECENFSYCKQSFEVPNNEKN